MDFVDSTGYFARVYMIESPVTGTLTDTWLPTTGLETSRCGRGT